MDNFIYAIISNDFYLFNCVSRELISNNKQIGNKLYLKFSFDDWYDFELNSRAFQNFSPNKYSRERTTDKILSESIEFDFEMKFTL